MWIYRRHVLNKERGVKRAVVMTNDQFRKCLMSVAADSGQSDWLVGRNGGERDRSPCHVCLKAIFIKRLQQEMGTMVTLMSRGRLRATGTQRDRRHLSSHVAKGR